MRVSRTWLRAGAAALILAPALALAHDYNYLEGGYVHRDQNDNESGFRAGGSFDVLNPVAIFAEYNHVDQFDQLSVGGLYHVNIQRGLDLNLGASLENVDVPGNNDTGFGLRAGLRWQVPNTRVEINPELRYINVGSIDDTSLRIAALYDIAPQVALEGAVQIGDDERFDLGARYYFGPRR